MPGNYWLEFRQPVIRSDPHQKLIRVLDYSFEEHPTVDRRSRREQDDSERALRHCNSPRRLPERAWHNCERWALGIREFLHVSMVNAGGLSERLLQATSNKEVLRKVVLFFFNTDEANRPADTSFELESAMINWMSRDHTENGRVILDLQLQFRSILEVRT